MDQKLFHHPSSVYVTGNVTGEELLIAGGAGLPILVFNGGIQSGEQVEKAATYGSAFFEYSLVALPEQSAPEVDPFHPSEE